MRKKNLTAQKNAGQNCALLLSEIFGPGTNEANQDDEIDETEKVCFIS